MVTDSKTEPRQRDRAQLPSRILLVRLSHLGDVVHALPVYHALRRAYPQAELAWAIQSEFAELVEPLPGLSRVFTFERRGGLASWWRLRKELCAWGPDWAVDAQANLKSAMLALTSGAARRTAPARVDWQEPWASHAATDHAPPTSGRHAVERNLQLARHVARAAEQPGEPEGNQRSDSFDLALRPDELEHGRRLLETRVPGDGRPLTILLIPSDGDTRSWPASAWHDLAARRASAGAQVLVLSGPAEEREGRALAQAVPAGPYELGSVQHWIGQRGLRELAAVFRAAAERGATGVTCDSGPMHLAAASGLPVLLLAGPQDPQRTGPWPVVAPGGEVDLHATLSAEPAPPCAPCLRRKCGHPSGAVCLSELSAETVVAALGSPAP